MEGVGTAWSIEIQELTESSDPSDEADERKPGPEDGTSAVAVYEQTIKDPKQDTAISRTSQTEDSKLEVETVDNQTFLAEQLEVLERLKAEDEKHERQLRKDGMLRESPVIDEAARVNEHIGPVQFNMGGIQVDADDMLRRLKVSVGQSTDYL